MRTLVPGAERLLIIANAQGTWRSSLLADNNLPDLSILASGLGATFDDYVLSVRQVWFPD